MNSAQQGLHQLFKGPSRGPDEVTGGLGFVILWPRREQLMGGPAANAVATCPQTGTICLDCSGTKSCQAWDELIEKRAMTPHSSSGGGIAAAATGHPPAAEDCPLLTCSACQPSPGFQLSLNTSGQRL